MGFFSDLFGGGSRRELDYLLNPLLRSKLEEFTVVDEDDVDMKHYFRFRNPDGVSEEFVVVYRRFDPELHYLRTHHRKAGEAFFVTINESVWSISISYLIDLGRQRAPSTRSQKNHLAAKVSAEDLRHPDWKPQGKPENVKQPETPKLYSSSPYQRTPTEQQKAQITESSGFRVNEYIVYPAHGVGQILAIEEQEIDSSKLKMFVVNFIKDKMTLRIPTNKIANVGVRKLSEPRLVTKAIEILRGGAQPTGPVSTGLAEIESKINSGDIIAISEVIRDLHSQVTVQEANYRVRALYETAIDRLSCEIAHVKHVSENEAIQTIKSELARQKPFGGEARSEKRQSNTPKISVDTSPWEISMDRYNEIGRVYEFNNLAGSGSKTRFDIRCRLTLKADRRTITPFIYFVVEPHLLEQAGFLVAMFAPSDALLSYKFFTIKAEPIATGANFLLLTSQEDAQQCLKVLKLGKQIMFRLMSEKEQIASFPLENDAGFSSSYNELSRRLSN